MGESHALQPTVQKRFTFSIHSKLIADVVQIGHGIFSKAKAIETSIELLNKISSVNRSVLINQVVKLNDLNLSPNVPVNHQFVSRERNDIIF